LVVHGYYVRNTNPRKRLHEIANRYRLVEKIEPFKFCMRCNGQLNLVNKIDVIDKISTKTAEFYTEFHQCGHCEQIYWKGSHYAKMEILLDEVVNGLTE
jgi:uncharacterized protein